MEINDFVRDHSLLKEDYRVTGGFAEFTHADIEKRIHALNKTCVLALVGPYGSGKSTELNRIRGRLADEEVEWLQFDAWRYPERKGLWDGLVIEAAKQLGQDKQARRSIDGHASALGKWGGVVPEILAGVGKLIPDKMLMWVGDKVGRADIADQANGKSEDIAGAGKVAAKVADNLFSKSPAKRVYEFEQILTDMLLSVKQSKIVIVVEDVDRSGPDGINFLETLSFFLSNNERLNEKKTIIAIAPISEVSYRENLEAYLKCVDYIEQFAPRIGHLDDFIEQVFGLGMHPDQSRAPEGITIPLPLFQQQLKDFLEDLFREFGSQMNMRKLKLIIREASSNYKIQQADGFTPDWRMTLCVQSMKYLKDLAQDKDNPPTYYDVFMPDGSIGRKSYFARFITAIVDNRRQNEEPTQSPVIGQNSQPAKGQDVVIDYDLDEGGIPTMRPFTDPQTQVNKMQLFIQGYYFKY